MVKGIAELKDYGKITIKVRPLMDANNINVYQMSKLADLKHSTVKSYYGNSPLSRVDLDVIAKFCYVLNCKVSDILEYTPKKR